MEYIWYGFIFSEVKWRKQFDCFEISLPPSFTETSLVIQTMKKLQCERPGFDPWVGKIPWRKEWQPIPVFLPGEFHGQRSLAGTVHGVIKSQTQQSDSVQKLSRVQLFATP